MKLVKEIINKNIKLIKYGIFGFITVFINLLLYKLMLIMGINYVISSIISYFIASTISYYFNLLLVFNNRIEPIKKEMKKIINYFSVRLVALGIDTLLLLICVEVIDLDEFTSKIIVSTLVILMTYILNKKILDKEYK